MFSLKTYRSRLIFFVVVLSAFLATVLYASSFYARTIMLDEAEENTRRTAQLLDANILAQHNELKRYAAIVRSDLQLQEYMYIIKSIAADTEPLDTLFHRQFSWLPVNHANIVSMDGKIVAGTKADHPLAIPSPGDTAESTRYEFSNNMLRLAASAPIFYREALLGQVVLDIDYDRSLLNALEQQSNGYIFIIKNGMVIDATNPAFIGKGFDRYTRRMHLGKEYYMLQRINLPGTITTPGLELWFATSETSLFEHIAQFNKLTLLFILMGAFGIISLWTFLLRNFQKPLRELAEMTDEVALGSLPEVSRQTERNEIDLLSNKFSDMVESLRDKQAVIEATQQQLQSLAITDTLTELYNRRHLLEIFPELLAEAQRNNKHISAVLIDIDHFKQINDRYGHLVGDQCLCEFASILSSNSRRDDFLFRIGGEEFLILTIGETGQGLQQHAEKIRTGIESHPIHFDDKTISITVSCGIAYIDPAGFDTEVAMNTLLKFADNAMYQAKHSGRNRTMTLESIAMTGKRGASNL
ncbi:MAG: diguanylate cyclase [Granulosicoccaceae bacterium]|jgi:diguanylate cyclase (GGDEF)-like protein